MFVSISGIDQSGKSSIINLLMKKLYNSKFYYFTKEPRLFFFKNSQVKRAIVRSKLNSLFFLLDRIIHKLKLIKHRNKIIISDRSVICGIAYAYANSRFNLFVHKLYYNKKWLIPIPNLVFYIVPKFNLKEKEFENEFRKKVLHGYDNIVPKFYPNIKIIYVNNIEGELNKSVKLIIKRIKDFLSNGYIKKKIKKCNFEKSIFDRHLPNIGDMKREQIDTSGCRGDGSSLMMRLGLFYTNEEYEKYRKNVMKKWKKFNKKF